MPLWFPFGPFGLRPDMLWVEGVLTELSVLHDVGAFDDAYLQRAWLMIMLVAVGDEPILDDPRLQEKIIHWLVQRSGLGEQASESPPIDDVFGAIETTPAGSIAEPTEAEPDVIHLLPGFSIAGRRWEFHLTDKDSNRCAPHGHDIEDHSVVLDPYTGVVVDKNGKELRKAKPKELRKLWKDKIFRRFAIRARNTLLEQQPWCSHAIPPIPN